LKNLWLEIETQELGPSARMELKRVEEGIERVRRENMDPGGKNKRAEHSKESLPSSKKYWTPKEKPRRRTREEIVIKFTRNGTFVKTASNNFVGGGHKKELCVFEWSVVFV
jgi:hypothetical protein